MNLAMGGNIIYLCAFLGAALLWFVIIPSIHAGQMMKARRKQLQLRPKMEWDKWLKSYIDPLSINSDLAGEVVSKLATTLGCDPTQIYPTDSFSDELALKIKCPLLHFIDPDDELEYFSEAVLEDLDGVNFTDSEWDLFMDSMTVEELIFLIHKLRTAQRTVESGAPT